MALWTKASLCGESSLSEQSLPRTPSWLKLNPCNLCPRYQWNLWFKIGKKSSDFQSKTLIPQNKNQNFQKFLTCFTKSSYENHEPIFEIFFRIKSAGSSNYRGSVFLLPEFTPSVCLLVCLPGATFFASGQKMPNSKIVQT